MKETFGSASRRLRFLDRKEAAEIHDVSLVGNASLVSQSSLLLANTPYAQPIVAVDLRIGAVLPVQCIPKVAQPIIGTIAVDVIDLVRRPVPVNVEPNEPMQRVCLSSDLAFQIPLVVDPSDDEILSARISVHPPAENSRHWIVRHQGMEFGLCDHPQMATPVATLAQ